MQILQYPNDNLRIKTKPVEEVTPELVSTANEMYKLMKAESGLGLASTQVGLDISLIVLEHNGKSLVMINPKTMKTSHQKENGPEGCLSFVGQFRNIKRATQVDVKYRDIHGKMQYIKLSGMMARAYLHETEHLSGILLIDHNEIT